MIINGHFIIIASNPSYKLCRKVASENSSWFCWVYAYVCVVSLVPVISMPVADTQ